MNVNVLKICGETDIADNWTAICYFQVCRKTKIKIN